MVSATGKILPAPNLFTALWSIALTQFCVKVQRVVCMLFTAASPWQFFQWNVYSWHFSGFSTTSFRKGHRLLWLVISLTINEGTWCSWLVWDEPCWTVSKRFRALLLIFKCISAVLVTGFLVQRWNYLRKVMFTLKMFPTKSKSDQNCSKFKYVPKCLTLRSICLSVCAHLWHTDFKHLCLIWNFPDLLKPAPKFIAHHFVKEFSN